jgi:hypothetical protein
MGVAALTARQIADRLHQIMARVRNATDEEWDAFEEAIRRVKEHDRLVQNVLPDLRSRLGDK